MVLTMATLEDLAKFDNGRVAVAFEQALRQLVFDLVDRPALDKDRTLTVTVQLQPRADSHGNLSGVVIDVDCKSKKPSQRSAAVVAKVIGGETVLRYNDLAPDDAEQLTIDHELARKENTK
jgi:hypothetical protein